jgi:hypothetical protein
MAVQGAQAIVPKTGPSVDDRHWAAFVPDGMGLTLFIFTLFSFCFLGSDTTANPVRNPSHAETFYTPFPLSRIQRSFGPGSLYNSYRRMVISSK